MNYGHSILRGGFSAVGNVVVGLILGTNAGSKLDLLRRYLVGVRVMSEVKLKDQLGQLL